MTFQEALKVANEKECLVNKLSLNNATLNEVLIAPTDPEEFAIFTQHYQQTLDAQKSIMPFIQSNLIVLGVFDKHRIIHEGIFLTKEL